MFCRWIPREPQGGEEPPELKTWARELNISDFLARLLWRRGLNTLRDMDVFLGPGLRHLEPLEAWPEALEAARVLAQAVQNDARVAVWGDYDVDGVTASALAVLFLRNRGISPTCHLPDRGEEGYGLNVAGVERLAEQGMRTLLTVDCGIADLEAVERARELGMTVVITDHHLPGQSLPNAQAILNPRLGESPYPNVAGVGAAFVLMAALNKLLPGQPDDMRRYLDLVALGTVADVVPLTPENRILVKNGLLLLGEAKRPGIFALKEVSSLPPAAPMGSGQVGFSLAPRINAAGRLGSPQTALDLLLAPDLSSARPLAAELEKLNQQRRKIEDDILTQALEQAREQSGRAGLVLFDESWHQGVIGIVASRVVEHSNRPALLLTKDGRQLKGSGRSIPEFDLYQGLSECSGVLTGFGGHRQAAGVKIDPDRVEDLRQAFHLAVVNQIGLQPLDPKLKLEAVLGLKAVDVNLVKEIDLLQPFGPGNPQPIFRSKPLKVCKHKIFGKNHVSLEVRDEQAGVTMLGKAWRQADRLTADLTGQSVLFAFTPRLNHYNGMTSIDLQVRDLCLASEFTS